MFKEYFILLLLAHVIGDFYFQTTNMSMRKDSRMKWVLLHSLFYWLSILFVLCSVMSLNILLIGTVAASSHALIDIFKYLFVKMIRSRGEITAGNERNIFFQEDSSAQSRES